MSREKVKEIVDYMVSEGTQNTNYGCWAFDIPELCDKFGLPLEWFYEHNDDICRELDERDGLLITSRTTTGTTIRWITTWFITRTSAILRRRDIYGRTSQSR